MNFLRWIIFQKQIFLYFTHKRYFIFTFIIIRSHIFKKFNIILISMIQIISFNFTSGDINNDSMLNVLDVVLIIGLILDSQESQIMNVEP